MSDLPVMIVNPETKEARVAQSAEQAKPGEVVLPRSKTPAAQIAELQIELEAVKARLDAAGL